MAKVKSNETDNIPQHIAIIMDGNESLRASCLMPIKLV